MDFYQDSRKFLQKLIDQHQIIDEKIKVISARTLTPEEAIGDPE